MKKYRALCFLWVCLLILAACAPSLAVPALRQFEMKTPAEIRRTLEGFTREMLLSAWGEPDAMLSGFFGDVWLFEEKAGRLIIYYDAYGHFQEAKILPVG